MLYHTRSRAEKTNHEPPAAGLCASSRAWQEISTLGCIRAYVLCMASKILDSSKAGKTDRSDYTLGCTDLV